MEEKIIKRFEGEQLTHLQQAICARYSEQENNDNASTNEYNSAPISIGDPSRLELVIKLKEKGAYEGANGLGIIAYNKIEVDNHFDNIVRGVLNTVSPTSPSQDRCIYHPELQKIWLGCATVVEKIMDGDCSLYRQSADLKSLLDQAYQLSRQYPEAAVVFNTLLIHEVKGEEERPTLGHYETFILKPDSRGYALCHRDSLMADNLQEYRNHLLPEIQRFVTAAGFVITRAIFEHPRYDQNGLSCGPSAVAEAIDFLLFGDQDAYDGFLKQRDLGHKRRFNAINPRTAYVDVNGNALTREEFMRLSLHYFLVVQQDNHLLQDTINRHPKQFICYLRKCDDPNTTYPVPSYLLEQYARDAYPSLFSPSAEVLHRGSQLTVSPGAAVSATQVATKQTMSQNNRAVTTMSYPWMAKFLLAVITHPITRYGCFLVCVAGLVGFGLAMSALFSTNPVALALIHSLAISAAATVAISGSVACVSGGLSLHGFLSSKKMLDNRLYTPLINFDAGK